MLYATGKEEPPTACHDKYRLGKMYTHYAQRRYSYNGEEHKMFSKFFKISFSGKMYYYMVTLTIK